MSTADTSTPSEHHYPDNIPIDELELIAIDRVLDWYTSQTNTESRIEPCESLQNQLWEQVGGKSLDRDIDETLFVKFKTEQQWTAFDTAMNAFLQYNPDVPISDTVDQLTKRTTLPA